MQAVEPCPNLLTLSAAVVNQQYIPALRILKHLPPLHFSQTLLYSLSINRRIFCLNYTCIVQIADMSLQVFYASVSGNVMMRKNQERIFSVLDSKSIEYEKVDITQGSDAKDLMRKKAGDPTALAPQICNGDNYCGDIDAFENAIENEQLEEFLKL
nr:SH3 domain-binding glutamic acid-rich-like protein 3 isoform X1 [Labrus bergylta]